MILASFREMQSIDGDLLQKRMDVIRVFVQTEDSYEAIVKDQQTGEHYLHHSDRHLNVTDAGTEEFYHSILPLENDEVIELMTGVQSWTYPDTWTRAYLRNGPDGYFIWFDPQMTKVMNADEQFGQALAERMKTFKQAGTFDLEAIESLFGEIDELRPGHDEQSEGGAQ